MTIRSQILLENVRLYGFHGVDAQETVVGAEYELTLRAYLSITCACETDAVADTVNYADMYAVIKREFDVPSKLIEHVGARIGRVLLARFDSLRRIDLKLRKVSPPIPGFTGSAAVELTFEK